MLALRASAVWEVIVPFKQVADLAEHYSKAMAEVLKAIGSANLSDVRTGDDHIASSVLCRLRDNHRKYMSLHVLDFIKQESAGLFFGDRSVRELEEEVLSCKSSLVFVNGQPERLVFLAVIQLWHGDAQLVEVGTVSVDGVFQSSKPQYPGSKRRSDETDEDAIARMIEETFAGLKPGPLQLGKEIREKTISAKFGLPSCYFKQTFTTVVDSSCVGSWSEAFGYLKACSGEITLHIAHAKEPTIKSDDNGRASKPRKVYAWLNQVEWDALQDLKNGAVFVQKADYSLGHNEQLRLDAVPLGLPAADVEPESEYSA